MTVTFKLNGKNVKCEADGKTLLVDTIRETFGLTGTKKACGTGDCGACTVLLNGKAIRSCTYLTAMEIGVGVGGITFLPVLYIRGSYSP